VVMPASRAARTQALAWSFSTWEACVSQFPYEISLTFKPLLPRKRKSMRQTLPSGQDGFSPRCTIGFGIRQRRICMVRRTA
jgi:hypothetical protein